MATLLSQPRVQHICGLLLSVSICLTTEVTAQTSGTCSGLMDLDSFHCDGIDCCGTDRVFYGIVCSATCCPVTCGTGTPIPTSVSTIPPTSQPSTLPSTVPTIPPTGSPQIANQSTLSPVTSNPTNTPSIAPSSQSPTSPSSLVPTSSPSGIPEDCIGAVDIHDFGCEINMCCRTDNVTFALLVSTACPLTCCGVDCRFTRSPTGAPSIVPSQMPTNFPTAVPSKAPSTSHPTILPTRTPTTLPTQRPTRHPSFFPSRLPTANPTVIPSAAPSASPSVTVTPAPTSGPTHHPSRSPESSQPSNVPTIAPTNCFGAQTIGILQDLAPPNVCQHAYIMGQCENPIIFQTCNYSCCGYSHSPSTAPTSMPSESNPTMSPTAAPVTSMPSKYPTTVPTTNGPSDSPSFSSPTNQPNELPTISPTHQPTTMPTISPTFLCANHPGWPNLFDEVTTETCILLRRDGLCTLAFPICNYTCCGFTKPPTAMPSNNPSSASPTQFPSITLPTHLPTIRPTAYPATSSPSVFPSRQPTTLAPTDFPTQFPSSSSSPSAVPTLSAPSSTPSMIPTSSPPSFSPSDSPTTLLPTFAPSTQPSTNNPSQSPSANPTIASPTSVPTTHVPTSAPSASPTTCTSAENSLMDFFPRITCVQVFESHSCNVDALRSQCNFTCCGYTLSPTYAPSTLPTASYPSVSPSISPTTSIPTTAPSGSPVTSFPTHTFSPTITPTLSPTTALPSRSPTLTPTASCSVEDGLRDILPGDICFQSFLSLLCNDYQIQQKCNFTCCLFTHSPSLFPTEFPTYSSPTLSPSTLSPSLPPTFVPSGSPHSSIPTGYPSIVPTSASPTYSPSKTPTTSTPTLHPTVFPTTSNPTSFPSSSPSSSTPTNVPTARPTTLAPSEYPTQLPTSSSPTEYPTSIPTSAVPSFTPTQSHPTLSPSMTPTPCDFSHGIDLADNFTVESCTSIHLSGACNLFRDQCNFTCCGYTRAPSTSPSTIPTSSAPTVSPSANPTGSEPTKTPTIAPISAAPTGSPSSSNPTSAPTLAPSTLFPSEMPSSSPTSTCESQAPLFDIIDRGVCVEALESGLCVRPGVLEQCNYTCCGNTLPPSPSPSHFPTVSNPTTSPTTSSPTVSPTFAPSFLPSNHPTISDPTESPSTPEPTTNYPSYTPSAQPTQYPTASPTTSEPTSFRDLYCANFATCTTTTDLLECPDECEGKTLSPSTSTPTTTPTSYPTIPPTATCNGIPDVQLCNYFTYDNCSNTSLGIHLFCFVLCDNCVTEIVSPTNSPSTTPSIHPSTNSPSTAPSIHPSFLPTTYPTQPPSSSLPTRSPSIDETAGICDMRPAYVIFVLHGSEAMLLDNRVTTSLKFIETVLELLPFPPNGVRVGMTTNLADAEDFVLSFDLLTGSSRSDAMHALATTTTTHRNVADISIDETLQFVLDEVSTSRYKTLVVEGCPLDVSAICSFATEQTCSAFQSIAAACPYACGGQCDPPNVDACMGQRPYFDGTPISGAGTSRLQCTCRSNCHSCHHDGAIPGHCTKCRNGFVLDHNSGDCIDPMWCSAVHGYGRFGRVCIGDRLDDLVHVVVLSEDSVAEYAQQSLNQHGHVVYNVSVPTLSDVSAINDTARVLAINFVSGLCRHYPPVLPTMCTGRTSNLGSPCQCSPGCYNCTFEGDTDRVEICHKCRDYQLLLDSVCVDESVCNGINGEIYGIGSFNRRCLL